LALAEEDEGKYMTILWLSALLAVLLPAVLLWRVLGHGVCLSALCLLQTAEERLDAYFEKPVNCCDTRLQKLC
jgi:hypothetical protein